MNGGGLGTSPARADLDLVRMNDSSSATVTPRRCHGSSSSCGFLLRTPASTGVSSGSRAGMVCGAGEMPPFWSAARKSCSSCAPSCIVMGTPHSRLLYISNIRQRGEPAATESTCDIVETAHPDLLILLVVVHEDSAPELRGVEPANERGRAALAVQHLATAAPPDQRAADVALDLSHALMYERGRQHGRARIAVDAQLAAAHQRVGRTAVENRRDDGRGHGRDDDCAGAGAPPSGAARHRGGSRALLRMSRVHSTRLTRRVRGSARVSPVSEGDD